ncbi:hypothetical protein [Candidatus Magnetomonas plexicatena]|uniref:hypothetical protein n=1 Tax=Candidatus Magnetomonas plexicatena TaxID=2552947 RepID=UPI001C756BD3|nr:hypothetical protein E2O03_011490 [Nitrospirales bacterium LBB_01]
MDDTSERRSLVAGGLAKALNKSGSAIVTAYDATAGLVSKAADAVTVLKPKGSVGPVFSRGVKLNTKGRLDLKIKDLEKILSSGKKNFKEFETKYDVFSTILRDLSILKKQLEKNQTGIEEKITTLSEQLMEVLESLSSRQSADGLGQTLPTINYVRREHEKIDYEKISDATKETLRDFEKRLAAFLSVSRDTHHELRGGSDIGQAVNESALSNLSKQIAGISKAISTLIAATVNIGAQKTDYDKIVSANKDALQDFERRFVPLTVALRDIPSLIGRLEKNQAAVEGKLTGLSKHTVDMLSALKGLLAVGAAHKGSMSKADLAKLNFDTIDYEKIADVSKGAMRDFEKLLVPLASALREIPSVINRIEQNQTGLESKLSALSKQTGNMVSVLNALLATGAGKSGQAGDYAKVNFETVDYERIDNAIKSALRGFENKLATLKSDPAGVSMPMTNTAENTAAIEGKLTELSKQMGDVVSVLKNFLAVSQRVQSTGEYEKIDYDKLTVERIDYEKIASINSRILTDLENKLDSLSSLSNDISIVKSQTKDVQSAVEGKLAGLTSEVTTVKGALVHIIRFLMTMSPKK